MTYYNSNKGGGRSYHINQHQHEINRSKECPFLLRVFINDEDGSFYKVNEFSSRKVPKNEIQIYTWRDATLIEITNLIKETNKSSRNKDSKFEFSFVFPDSKGVYISKYLGTVYSNKKSDDDTLTLDDLFFNYQYLNVALTVPNTTTTTTKSDNTDDKK